MPVARQRNARAAAATPALFVGWMRRSDGVGWVALCQHRDYWKCWDKLLDYEGALVTERVVLRVGEVP